MMNCKRNITSKQMKVPISLECDSQENNLDEDGLAKKLV